MTKLEELTEATKKLMDGAKEPEQVKEVANIQNLVEEVQKEQEGILQKNASLFNAYKEAVKSQTFKPEAPPSDGGGQAPVDIMEALQQVRANHAKKA